MTLEKIANIVADQLGVDASTVKPENSFKEDLGVDSLDLFQIIMAFEEEFGIEIPTEEAEKIITVQDAISYIESKQA